MPNRRVDPEEKVKKRNLCFTDKDWALFNGLISINNLDLTGVSVLFRLLAKSIISCLDTDLTQLGAELSSQNYPSTLRGLLQSKLALNDRIHN